MGQALRSEAGENPRLPGDDMHRETDKIEGTGSCCPPFAGYRPTDGEPVFPSAVLAYIHFDRWSGGDDTDLFGR